MITGFSILEVTRDLTRKGFDDTAEVEAGVDSYRNARGLETVDVNNAFEEFYCKG